MEYASGLDTALTCVTDHRSVALRCLHVSQGEPVTDYVVKPLDASTWDAFARLVERHNGVFGGCWCTYFHTFHAEKTFTVEGNRTLKKRLVEEGRAHAALVFDGDEAVAWCQYGPPEELPNIYHRKEYEAAIDKPPDYRITCIFVDKKHRREGVTAVALGGAVDLIAQAGGGVVEAVGPQSWCSAASWSSPFMSRACSALRRGRAPTRRFVVN